MSRSAVSWNKVWGAGAQMREDRQARRPSEAPVHSMSLSPTFLHRLRSRRILSCIWYYSDTLGCFYKAGSLRLSILLELFFVWLPNDRFHRQATALTRYLLHLPLRRQVCSLRHLVSAAPVCCRNLCLLPTDLSILSRLLLRQP